jgi:cell division FtsZ-interacting protein ZapD
MEESLLMANHRLITFEAPACELVRTSLSIESLLTKIKTALNNGDNLSLENCVHYIARLLNVTNKPELRSKYYQTFSKTYYHLSKLTDQHSNLCEKTWSNTLTLLKVRLDGLSLEHGKFAESLRESPFFKSYLQCQGASEADLNYSLPGYHLWLSLDTPTKQQYLQQWLKEFDNIEAASKTLLSLVRDAEEFSEFRAENGFFQHSLDKRCQLIRLSIPVSEQLFAKFSIGHHGASIQFFSVEDYNLAAKKVNRSVPFLLSLCKLF